MMIDLTTVFCPELVEGPYFFSAVQEEGRGFDKLSPDGIFVRANGEIS